MVLRQAVAITRCRSTRPGCASTRHYNVVSKAFPVLKYEMFVILYGSVFVKSGQEIGGANLYKPSLTYREIRTES